MFALLGIVGCVVGGTDGEWTFEDATAVSVRLANGSVTVTSSIDDLAVVTYDGGGIGRAALPDVGQSDDGAVHVGARGQLGGGDVTVELPAGVPLDATVDRGDITITLDAPSSIDACVAAGSITITVPPGEYDLDLDVGAGHVGTGIVDVDGAEHVVSACVGAGDVTIEAALPEE